MYSLCTGSAYLFTSLYSTDEAGKLHAPNRRASQEITPEHHQSEKYQSVTHVKCVGWIMLLDLFLAYEWLIGIIDDA